MHTITEIEKTIYLNKPDYDHMMRYPEIARGGYPKKTRGINVKGVMKNTKCYHVVLDEEYLKHIQSISKVYLPKDDYEPSHKLSDEFKARYLNIDKDNIQNVIDETTKNMYDLENKL